MEFNLIDNHKLAIKRSGKKYPITLLDPVRKPIPIRTLGKEFWFDWTRNKSFMAELAEKVGCAPNDLMAPLEAIGAEIELKGRRILEPQRPPKKTELGKEAEKVDPMQYFEIKEDGSVGKFVPKRLADGVTKDYHFATHRESFAIYRYQDGLYLPDGEATIRELCREKLDDLATEHHVNEVIKQIQDTTFKRPKKFESAPELLCVKNGILNTINRELKPHTPSIIFLSKLPVEYNPEAKCPTILKRLHEWTGGNMKDMVKLIQFAGFCLYRNYFIRKVIIIHGEGSNGKTTFVLFMTRWLGENNIVSVKVQKLEKRFTAARLFGKLANLCDDLPGTEWFSTGAFKQATGGSPLDAEKKFKDEFSYVPYAKMLFTGNRMPIVNDDTLAFWDRIALISFIQRFVGDKKRNREDILKEMLTGGESGGFLNLALEGLASLLDANEFFAMEDTEETKKRYIKISDPVMAFGHERAINDPEANTVKRTIYAAYADYCLEKGFPIKENNAFARSFKRVYPHIEDSEVVDEDGKRHNSWKGVALRPLDEEPSLKGSNDFPQVPQDTHVISLFKSITEQLFLSGIKIVDPYKIDISEYPAEPTKPAETRLTKPPNPENQQELGVKHEKIEEKITTKPTTPDKKTPPGELGGAQERPTWLPCKFIADHPRSAFIDPDTNEQIELGPFERGDRRGIPAQFAHQMALKGIVEILKETAEQPEDLGEIVTLPPDIQGLLGAAAVLTAISDGAPHLQYKIPKMANVPRQICFDTLATIEEKGYVKFEDWGEKVAVKITDKGKEALK